MTPSRRRLVLGSVLAAAALLFCVAYLSALVPATHSDHDHGILNLDAGGRLLVTTRDGTKRNLVGAPGRVLVIHFFSTAAAGAAEELRGFVQAAGKLRDDRGVELLLIAKDPDFGAVDAWLAANRIVLPRAESLVLDPSGETTERLNSKRPLETMFFNSQGKLASQARGTLDWISDAPAQIDAARVGATIE